LDKEELIHIHMLLYQVKMLMEQLGVSRGFKEYEALNIKPVHVHRSKSEHKRAIFVLGNEIAKILSDRFGTAEIISEKMREFSERVATQVH
jgi:hypothetical protein